MYASCNSRIPSLAVHPRARSHSQAPPGAVPLSVTALLAPSATPSASGSGGPPCGPHLKPKDELEAVFEAAGVDFGQGGTGAAQQPQQVVVYCEDGTRSPLVALALCMLGHPRWAVCDGGWDAAT